MNPKDKNQEEICENCGYQIDDCNCIEDDDSDELFKENPLKAIWIKLREIEEMLEGGE